MGISKSYDGRLVVPPLDLLITPKSRIGLLGPNGCGKSTLIRLLTGQEKPDQGTVFRSDGLQVSVFEQNRESLDPSVSVLRAICPAGDFVDFAGTKIHARGYLGRFLFRPEQMELPVGRISGGEQSRLLLARLMLRKANLLVLDEPTNDLDAATLDILAEVLAEFPGAILLVTHDRYFLDQVASLILAFGAGGKITRFAGLEQWEDWRDRQEAPGAQAQAPAPNAGPASSPAPEAAAAPAKRRKLGFKEQRELDGMEAAIEAAEKRLTELTAESAGPAACDSGRLVEITSEMARVQAEIDRLYARWSELERR